MPFTVSTTEWEWEWLDPALLRLRSFAVAGANRVSERLISASVSESLWYTTRALTALTGDVEKRKTAMVGWRSGLGEYEEG